ncbi:hypothetical protein AB0I22_19695 [Streptomyces sp. NPDC050610]|uniref:hypothetical protein n=1 Tax=Streptomyces sp. NPDC050610 TaxID=3157097 RepID=UPI003419498B
MTTTSITLFAPFPDQPADLAEYAAARSAEEAETYGPPPWDIGALPEELRASLLEWLDTVCRWLNQTYTWQPQHAIPPCWQEHEHLGYEIAALAFARADAYEDAGSAVVWHEQYARFQTRMSEALGKAGDECRVGRHENRPARFQLDAWASTASL